MNLKAMNLTLLSTGGGQVRLRILDVMARNITSLKYWFSFYLEYKIAKLRYIEIPVLHACDNYRVLNIGTVQHNKHMSLTSPPL